MHNPKNLNRGIPVSVSLDSALENEALKPQKKRKQYDKKRLFRISVLAVLIAVVISFIAKLLVYLIDLFSNISFHQTASLHYISPATHSLGFWVIFIPVIGGLIVGFMALYGSKAIRGHGIPEAMEQILVNQSKIRPSITYLKPLSAAISIGTGGPFGAEGPIIATGGAFGSTIGQLLHISSNERKILLAAGATAGMSAIFGSPIAAIFLAIELLLFEFSPRSILPVALACITGAAGHHLLFEAGPVFPMPILEFPSNIALATYSLIGLIMGILAIFTTKIVYFIEDLFEKLPIHWMWWPAIGGLFVGIIGFFAPRTLGVGYENITDVLSGTMPVKIILSLCILKFISWAIALGSGTSGGTLAPLLTIGGAAGALLGGLILEFFPGSDINIPLAALVGMSAMFAGASRALLTSIIFAIETTFQFNGLVALLGACTGSYFVSFFLMENTIMTEKIARRGVATPVSYEPDILEKLQVSEVITPEYAALNAETSIAEIRNLIQTGKAQSREFYVLQKKDGSFAGIISLSDLYLPDTKSESPVADLAKQAPVWVSTSESLRQAVEIMANQNLEVLPVVSSEDHTRIMSLLTYKDVFSAYKVRLKEHEKGGANISLKRQHLKMMLKSQHFLSRNQKK